MTVIMLTIFALTLLISLVFTINTVNFYNALSTNYGVTTTAQFPGYLEVAYLLGGILVFTGVMLLLIKYNLSKIIIAIFAIVSFLVLIEFFDVILSPLFFSISQNLVLVSFVAAILLVVYYFKYGSKLGRNLINIMIFVTIASAVGLTLGVLPSIILIAAIAIYDYIAVFVTKHMITLANALVGKSFIGGIVFAGKRIKKGMIMLGGGDIVFPAIFIDALYLNYPPLASILVLIGAVVGISIILFFGKRNKAYPAMSIIAPAQIGFFGLYLLLTMI